MGLAHLPQNLATLRLFKTSFLAENWADEWTGWPWQFTYKKIPRSVFVPCLMDKVFNHSLECQIFDESAPHFLEKYNISYSEDVSAQDEDRVEYIHELHDFWYSEHANYTYILPASNFSRQYILSMYWSSLTLTTRGQQVSQKTSITNQ